MREADGPGHSRSRGETKQPRPCVGLLVAGRQLYAFSALAALVHCTVCAGPVPSPVTTNIRAAQ